MSSDQSTVPNHNKNKRAPLKFSIRGNAKKIAVATLGGLGLVAAVVAFNPSLSYKDLWAPIANVFAVEEYDPFEMDTWHAVGGTWPGTIKFHGESNQVTLRPLGAPVMEASYEFEITQSSSKKLSQSKLIEGSLMMRNAAGQVSLSTFKIENGDKLHLTYHSGQRPEQYIRLDEAGVAAQKDKIEKMLKEGVVNSIPVPPVLQQNIE